MKAFWVSAFAVAMLASAMPASRADNAEPQWRYSSSLLDEPKYPADFKHYDYVNPDAPKGGTLNLVAVALSTTSIHMWCRVFPPLACPISVAGCFTIR